jgi:hypothetical protein
VLQCCGLPCLTLRAACSAVLLQEGDGTETRTVDRQDGRRGRAVTQPDPAAARLGLLHSQISGSPLVRAEVFTAVETLLMFL